MTEEKILNESTPQAKIFPRRYLLLALSFFGLFHVTLLRANLSVAVVAMKSNQTVTDSNGTETYNQAEFDWNSEQEGVLLASFFYGFFTTQMAGGILAPMIGGGRLVGLAMMITCILTLFSPMVAYSGFIPLVSLRSILGMIQGMVFPSIHELWSHWAPPLESTKILAITYSGAYIGTVSSMGFCGIIASFLGWPWIFYIFGSTGLLWCLAWFTIVREKPSKDKHISAEELQYLSATIDQTQRTSFSDTPWRSIFTSLPIWAAIISCSAESYTYYLLMTQLPMYLHDTTDLNIEDVGFLSAVPYLAMAVTAQFSGIIADTLRSKYNISTTVVRKISTCGAYFVQAIVLVSISYVDSLAAIVTCLTITLAVSGCSSFTINFFDLAPQYASLIIGFANTIACIAGLISPTMTGFIIKDRLVSEWQIVFYIAASVALFGGVFYAIFGSGELQPWAKQDAGVDLTNEDSVPKVSALDETHASYCEMETEIREAKNST